MKRTGLTSLKNFPHLKKLKWLILADNSIKDDELIHMRHLPKLYGLNLEFNNIKYLNTFYLLTNLRLNHLFLAGNKVNEKIMHEQLFEILPYLKTVDGLNIGGQFDTLSSWSDES